MDRDGSLKLEVMDKVPDKHPVSQIGLGEVDQLHVRWGFTDKRVIQQGARSDFPLQLL